VCAWPSGTLSRNNSIDVMMVEPSAGCARSWVRLSVKGLAAKKEPRLWRG
jgi:hypothetical protein